MSSPGRPTVLAAVPGVVWCIGVVLVLSACAPDEPEADPAPEEVAPDATPEPTPTQPPATVEVDSDGLPPAAEGLGYALWLDGPDGRQRLGPLQPDAGAATFDLDADPDGVDQAFLALEAEDSGPWMLAAGDVEDGVAELRPEHAEAVGPDWQDASGTFILGTPTDPPAPETAGAWFLELDPPRPSLELPTAPAGWEYAAWALVDGPDGEPAALGLGRIVAVDAASAGVPHNGPSEGPDLPGGDLVADPPEGFEFPLELHAAEIVISLEPDEVATDRPSALRVQSGTTPDPAEDHESYPLEAPEPLVLVVTLS